MLKALLLSTAVLAVAAVIQCAEPARAAARRVTSADVQVVSEQTLMNEVAAFGKNGGGKGPKKP